VFKCFALGLAFFNAVDMGVADAMGATAAAAIAGTATVDCAQVLVVMKRIKRALAHPITALRT
jgi:hypothetical protein